MASISSLMARGKEFASVGTANAERVSPILLRDFYDEIVQECVQGVGQIYQFYTCDVTDGQDVYCTPPLDVIEAAYITDSDTRATNPGKKYGLVNYHSHDARGGHEYTEPDSGLPKSYITEGTARLRLSPAPDYTKTGALEIHGYGPYTPSAYADTDECPLKAQDEVAVVRGIAWRVLEYLEMPRAASVERLYRSALNQIEINAHEYAPSSRVRGVAGLNTSGALNPLNL